MYKLGATYVEGKILFRELLRVDSANHIKRNVLIRINTQHFNGLGQQQFILFQMVQNFQVLDEHFDVIIESSIDDGDFERFLKQFQPFFVDVCVIHEYIDEREVS